LQHAGIANCHTVKIVWLNAGSLTEENIEQKLAGVKGILVPGGFGVRDTEGKVLAIRYAREHHIPFFGICLGMQLALIEFARNVLKISNASSTEFGDDCAPVISLMSEWQKGEGVQYQSHNMGGTMRLGAYPCALKPQSLANAIYGGLNIFERHRHRYEFNITMRSEFEAKGMEFSGLSPDGQLAEIIELPQHPWFIGVQFHPELKSRSFSPHPLFKAFIAAALKV
jgi:CTP synthase